MEYFTVLLDSCIWILKILLIGLIAFITGIFLAWLKEKNGKTKQMLQELLNQCEVIKKSTGILNQKINDLYILVNNCQYNKRHILNELVKIRKANKTILSRVQLIDNNLHIQGLTRQETLANISDDNKLEKLLDLPMECIRLNIAGNSVLRGPLECRTIRDVLKTMITNQRKGLGMYRRLGRTTINQLESYFENSGLLKIEKGIYYSNIINDNKKDREMTSS